MRLTSTFAYTLALTALLATAAPAQELLEITYEDAKKEVALDLSNLNHDIVLRATVRNVSGRALQLKWTRESPIQPQEWLTQVCDNHFCYLPSVGTNFDPRSGTHIPLILLPDETLQLVLHVFPSGRAGVGYFTIPLALTERPDEPVARAEFQVKVEHRTTLQGQGRGRLSIFPNPATLYFELADEGRQISQIVLYNTVGRPVRTFQAAGGVRYSIADLPAGMYMVSLRNTKGEVVRTLRLVKRSLRA